jgi:hypothetical protein
MPSLSRSSLPRQAGSVLAKERLLPSPRCGGSHAFPVNGDVDLCKPERDAVPSQHQAGQEDQDASGCQLKLRRAIPREAARNAAGESNAPYDQPAGVSSLRAERSGYVMIHGHRGHRLRPRIETRRDSARPHQHHYVGKGRRSLVEPPTNQAWRVSRLPSHDTGRRPAMPHRDR